jgi:hypothetical protein
MTNLTRATLLRLKVSGGRGEMAFHITKANRVTFPQIIALRARLGRAQYVLISFVPCLFIVQTSIPIPRAMLPRFPRNVTLIPVTPYPSVTNRLTKPRTPCPIYPSHASLLAGNRNNDPAIDPLSLSSQEACSGTFGKCDQSQKSGRNATVFTFAPLFNLPIAIIVWLSFGDNNPKVLSSGKEH